MGGSRPSLHTVPSCSRTLQLLFVVLLGSWAVPVRSQIPAELVPPAAQRKAWSARLAPLDEILKGARQIPVKSTDSGIVLDSELVWIVDPSGRRVILVQSAYKSVDESGAKDNADDTVEFLKNDQKIYVLSAESIQPDGTHQNVKSNALLLQSPQRQADYSLYDDEQELKVIFPNVKPGTVTHLIYAIEDQVPRFPGEFCGTCTWSYLWPVGTDRYELDLPESLEQRFKISMVGSPVPPDALRRIGDRVIHEWTLRNRAATPYERSSPPAAQAGPALDLTTIGSWDAVDRWYRQMLNGRNLIRPPLAAEIRKWTAGKTTRLQKVEAIFQKIADNVRYVGLEFGSADYQPHDCNEVWENQYGDCKDKANLLVAALGSVGIPARIALVNTNSAGWVDQRSPSYRYFNHAIVAIPEGAGAYLFCDPTISYSRPGLLGPADGDRDVLILGPERAEWAHTPSASAGGQDYKFDLKLSALGELSGWFSLRSTGYYATRYRDEYSTLSVDDARTEAARLVQGFFDGAEVIDISRTNAEAEPAYTVKAFFIVNPKSGDGGARSLKFPTSADLFYDLGEQAERQNPFYLYADITTCQATVVLPPGIHPQGLPTEFSFHSPAAKEEADWSFDGLRCRANLLVDMRQPLIAAGDFPTVYRSQKALRAWLSQPLVLTADAGPTPAVARDDAATLPLMPTGEGQLKLVDRRFPSNGDLAARRQALAQVLRFFPDDQPTVFDANIDLAVADWDDHKPAAAEARLRPILNGYSSQMTRETYGWASYIEAMVQRDLGQTKAAEAQLDRLIGDASQTDWRRSVSATALADLVIADDAPRALRALALADGLPNGSSPDIDVRLIHGWLLTGRDRELRARLTKIQAAAPNDFAEGFATVLDAAADWALPGDSQRAAHLAEAMQSLVPAPPDRLMKAIDAAKRKAAYAGIQQRLAQLAKSGLLARWRLPEPTGLEGNYAAVDKQLANDDQTNGAAHGLRLSVTSLLWGLPADFPARLKNAADYAEWLERLKSEPIDPGVCTALLDLCDQLPSDDFYFYEGKYLRSSRLKYRGDFSGQRAQLRLIVEGKGSAPGQIVTAYREWGRSLENAGDWAGAAAIYERTSPFAADYGSAGDCLLRATFIDLDRGDFPAALRIINELAALKDGSIKFIGANAQVRELIALVRTGHAQEFWANAQRWWPDWTALAARVGLPKSSVADPVPVIADLTALGTELGTARQEGRTADALAAFARLVAAGRWQPSSAVEIASLQAYVEPLMPNLSGPFRKFLVDLLGVPHPPDMPGRWKRSLVLAAFDLDGGQSRLALEITRDFDRSDQPDDDTARAMHFLHALAAYALHEDAGIATRELEHDLTGTEQIFGRKKSVVALADLYRQAGRAHDEEALLRRELKRTDWSDGDRAMLNHQWHAVTDAQVFNQAVAQWVRSLHLNWYDSTEPLDLKDPRLRNLDRVLSQPKGYFTTAGQAKFLLLAAQDGRLSLEQRRKSWLGAAEILIREAPTYTQIEALARATIDNPNWEDVGRGAILGQILTVYAREGQKGFYGHWRRHPLVQNFTAEATQNLDWLDQLLQINREDPAAVLALANQVSAAGVNAYTLPILDELVTLLIELGPPQNLDHLIDDMANWNWSAESLDQRDQVELRYRRWAEASGKYAAMHRALATILERRFPSPPASLPAEFKDFRLSRAIPMREPGPTLDACRFLLHHHRVPGYAIGFWGIAIQALRTDPNAQAIQIELLDAVFAAPASDEAVSAMASLLSGTVDLDDAQMRGAFLRDCARFRGSPDYPATNEMLHYLDVLTKARQGEPVDPESALQNLDEPLANAKKILRLRLLLAKGDSPGLRRTIDAFDPDTLLKPDTIAYLLPAFRSLGMQPELGLATNVAKQQLRQTVADSWVTLDIRQVDAAVTLLNTLDDAALINDAWIDEIERAGVDPYTQGRLRLVSAELRHDWPRAAATAARLVHTYPTRYHEYWSLGRALHELKRDREAAQALAVYCHWAHDEREFPQAVALLKQVGPP